MSRTEVHPGWSGFVDVTRERGIDLADDVRTTAGQARDGLGDAIDRLSTMEWPKVELPSVDVGKALAGAAAAAHIGRRAHRRRWPLVVGGLLVAGLVGWAISSREALRAQLALGANSIRNRISAARSNLRGRPEIERGHPIAFTAAETAPIGASRFTDSRTHDGDGYPLGFGSNNGDGLPNGERAAGPPMTATSGDETHRRPGTPRTPRGTT